MEEKWYAAPKLVQGCEWECWSLGWMGPFWRAAIILQKYTSCGIASVRTYTSSHKRTTRLLTSFLGITYSLAAELRMTLRQQWKRKHFQSPRVKLASVTLVPLDQIHLSLKWPHLLYFNVSGFRNLLLFCFVLFFTSK